MRNINSNQFDDMSSDFILDMIAFFNIAEEQYMKLLDTAEEEHWTPDQLLSAINDVI
jgi:hypothetical protein